MLQQVMSSASAGTPSIFGDIFVIGGKDRLKEPVSAHFP
jgi:hypothetical protein